MPVWVSPKPHVMRLHNASGLSDPFPWRSIVWAIMPHIMRVIIFGIAWMGTVVSALPMIMRTNAAIK